jgi:hypothetical protein
MEIILFAEFESCFLIPRNLTTRKIIYKRINEHVSSKYKTINQ